MTPRLLEVFQRIGSVRALVVGDVCVDLRVALTQRRVNPESDAPCWRRGEGRALSHGMASNVARHLKAWSADVRHLWTGPLSEKRRYVDPSGRTVFRVDDDHLADLGEAKRLLRVAIHELDSFRPQAVALVDYGKGALPVSDELRTLIRRARQENIPVLVDPARGADWRNYAGATLIKPNWVERPSDTSAFDFCDVLLTGGRMGATLFSPPGTGRSAVEFRVKPRNVIDPCGAGDAAMAMLTYCLAGGVAIEDACRLANHAGGLAVERNGTPAITREELIADLG